MRTQTTTKAQRKRKQQRRNVDEPFLKWIRTLPSCMTNDYCEWVNGEGRNPACHVKRALDSGTGFKAQLSAIPMRNDQHALQHQKGESACLARYLGGIWTTEEAKDWYYQKAEFYRNLWFAEYP